MKQKSCFPFALFLFATVWMLVALLVSWGFLRELYHQYLIDQKGVAVEATLEEKKADHYSDHSDYRFLLSFSTPKNPSFKASIKVAYSDFARYDIFQPVPIRYLPSDPSVFMLANEEASYLMYYFVIPILAFFVLIGVFLFLLVFLGYKQQKRLRDFGIKTQAVVLYAHQETNTREIAYIIDYEFRDHRGKKRTSSTSSIPVEKAKPFLDKGVNIEIIFDPEDPENNDWSEA